MSLEDDWIERQIRRFAEAIARALGLSSAGQRDAGHALLDDTARANLGIGLQVARSLPAAQLARMMAPVPDPRSHERIAQLAGLLMADADVDDAPAEDARREKAAALLAHLPPR